MLQIVIEIVSFVLIWQHLYATDPPILTLIVLDQTGIKGAKCPAIEAISEHDQIAMQGLRAPTREAGRASCRPDCR